MAKLIVPPDTLTGSRPAELLVAAGGARGALIPDTSSQVEATASAWVTSIAGATARA